MKLVKREPEEGRGMNMTPMIDVVFQLLIFFMLVTEMSQQELAALVLPRATEAIPDRGERGRHTINVTEDGIIKVGMVEMTLDELERRVIEPEARLWREDRTSGDDQPRPSASEKPILIRADAGVEFGIIQQIMARCVKHGIWRISFGAMIGSPGEADIQRGAGL